LRAALSLQTQLGAYRGIGFGRTKGVEVAPKLASAGQPLVIADSPLRQCFSLQIDGALCVGSSTRSGNIFVSSDQISGGTIKAALAQTLLAMHGAGKLSEIPSSALARHLDAIRLTHAFPAKEKHARPLPLPQSLVWYKEEIWDARNYGTAPAGLECAPAFKTDWKRAATDVAAAAQCWGETEHHLRVRTAIAQGQAEKSSLFAYDCVVAKRDGNRVPQTRWLFDVDLAAIPSTAREDAWCELAELFQYGLAPLGKTDVRGQISIADESTLGAVWRSGIDAVESGALVSVVLATDSLLFPTDEIAVSPGPKMIDVYRAAFESLMARNDAAGAMALSHIFATQRLAGGEYLSRRFMKDRAYQPFVLTEAGSVFVFRILDAELAKAVMGTWQSHGLPLPDAVVEAYGQDWQSHPYLPKNGFGEVSIDPSHGFRSLDTVHVEVKPGIES
jgi:hypothetical protein